jgi:hypothetical protein
MLQSLSQSLAISLVRPPTLRRLQKLRPLLKPVTASTFLVVLAFTSVVVANSLVIYRVQQELGVYGTESLCLKVVYPLLVCSCCLSVLVKCLIGFHASLASESSCDSTRQERWRSSLNKSAKNLHLVMEN